MAKTIVVDVRPDGSLSIDLAGFKGQGCSKVIEDLAGGEKPRLTRLKREYHETDAQKEKQNA